MTAHLASQQIPCSLFAPIKSVIAHRRLIARLGWREIQSRYKGSLLGIAWSVLVPIILLAVYTFVFSVVFSSRWGTENSSKTHFAIVVFAGLIVFNIFADCIVRAPSLILHNVSYVKKVVFPLEILPWVSLCSALFNALVSLVVLTLFFTAVEGVPPLSFLLAPLVILPLALLIVGLSLFLASLGVFIRDLQQFIGVIITVVMFLSPLFYPLSALPSKFRSLVELSPVTMAVEGMRTILFEGTLPNLELWVASLAFGLVSLWLGFLWFAKTRKGFADVV